MTSAPLGEQGDNPGAVQKAAPDPGFPQRLPALTSLRFWLALGVVLFHYQLNILPTGGTGLALIERARLAVDVFFILSGFVLAHAYGRQLRDGSYSHRRFLIARLARIYPAHLAMLIFMALIAGAAVLFGQPFDAASYSLTGFLQALFLIHAWLPATVANEWNGPSWSLSAEWAAYLAFPVFAWIGLKANRRPWITIGLALGLFVLIDAVYRRVFGETVIHAELILGVLRIVPEFLLGVGLYQLGSTLNPSLTAARITGFGALTLTIVLMTVGAEERAIVAASAVMVLGLAWLSRWRAEGLFAHPVAIEFGEASYALYLVHLPLLIVWKNSIGMLMGMDSGYRMSVPEAGLLLAVTLVAALTLHAGWERPARAFIRRRFLGRPSLSTSPEKVPQS